MLPMPSQPESHPSSRPQPQGELGVPVNHEISPSAPERVGEMRPVAQPTIPAPVVASHPTPAMSQPSRTTTIPSTDPATPLVADDVDVIEKEWVDKAKKIVSSTKEDPHAQEQQVSKLQADYLMKRYNKQIKLAE